MNPIVFSINSLPSLQNLVASATWLSLETVPLALGSCLMLCRIDSRVDSYWLLASALRWLLFYFI